MRRHLANCKLLDLKEVTGWDFLTCLNNLTFSFLYFTDLQRDWFSTEENRMQLWLSLDFQHIARYYLWRMWLIFTVLYVGLINGGVWKVLRGWRVYLAVQSTLYIYIYITLCGRGFTDISNCSEPATGSFIPEQLHYATVNNLKT